MSLDGFVEWDAELRGEGGDPGEHVAQLVDLLVAAAFASGAGELADFFGQVGDGRGKAARPIALAVGPLHHPLEFLELHGRRLRRLQEILLIDLTTNYTRVIM